jgi:hypothetical protein
VDGAVLNNYSSTISNTGNMSVGGNVTNYNTIANSGAEKPDTVLKFWPCPQERKSHAH